MIWRVLNNSQWERVAPLPPGKAGDPGRTAADNRRFLEAVLWIARVGAPWRDLPDPLGNWNSAFKRFRRWTQKGVFERPFQAVIRGPRLRICDHRRNHHPCPSTWRRRKRGPQNQDIGRPRGGLTTKIVALVNALGNLARFVLLLGQRHDSEFIRFLNAVQRAVPAGKVIHATADNYATHKHPNILRWLADHPRWDLPFYADLGVVAQCRGRNFSTITRRKIRRGVFKSVADLEGTISRYIKAHNKTSKPFEWTASAPSIYKKLAQTPEPSE